MSGFFSRKYLGPLLLVSLLLFLLILSYLPFYNKPKKFDNNVSNPVNKINRPDPVQSTSPKKKSALPEIMFSNYALNFQDPKLPQVLYKYQFKTNFSRDDVVVFANNLEFNPSSNVVSENDNYVTVTNMDCKCVLNFDKTTGSFYFYRNIENKPFLDSSIIISATNFLTDVGVTDEYLCQTATYKKDSLPGITFVEFHHCWDMIGLPILNLYGGLNLDNSEKISSLKLGQIKPSDPDDPEITDTSDKNDKKVRPNTFNTVTVSVDDTTRQVTAITSSLRPIISKESIDQTRIKSSQEAVNEVKQGNYYLALSQPSGQGITDVNKIFQDNKAIGEIAEIFDSALVYIEFPIQDAQSEYSPMYLLRGRGRINSGYDIDFYFVVKADKNDVAGNQVKGTSTQTSSPGCREAGGMKYCTIIFGPKATPTTSLEPTPSISIPTLIPTEPPVIPTNTIFIMPSPTIILTPTPIPATTDCPPFTHQYILPNGAKIAFTESNYDLTQPRRFWYIPLENDRYNESNATGFLATEMKINGKDVIGFCTPSTIPVCQASDDIKNADKCIEVGLVSPLIYIHAKEPTDINLKPGFFDELGFVDPVLNNKTWQFKAIENQLIFSNGLIKDRLYYEYKKRNLVPLLTKNLSVSNSIVVKKSEAVNTINNNLIKAGAAKKITDDFNLELNRELKSINSELIKISLIDQEIVDKYLPVMVDPKPQSIIRIHFVLQKADSGNQNNKILTLPAIKNHDYSLLELGLIPID